MIKMRRYILIFLFSLFVVNYTSAGPKGYIGIRIECTNDNNFAVLKWKQMNVDRGGSVYIQIDLNKDAKKNLKFLVDVSDGERVILTKEVEVKKGDDTSYANEVYLGRKNEGQTMHFRIMSVRCK